MLSTREPRLVAGRYELRGVIARGGMGEVYAARDLRLDRDVAVKRLRDALPAARAARARVEREARLAATLNHRNVVSVFDVGIDRGRPFMVMERLDGGSLRDVVSRGAMSESDVRRVASD